MGSFVISLDFELWWGVRDSTALSRYRDNLLGERVAVTTLLEHFHQRGIRATWATVGALFCQSRKQLLDVMPTRKPKYEERRLSPYDALDEVGVDEAADPLRFAPSLVRKIAQTPGQELATHTFSHFYCLEDGQTESDFDADLKVAQALAKPFGGVRSLVFPRNQYNPAYRSAMHRRGIRAFRSNGSHWAYAPKTNRDRRRRAVRLVDAYLPITGSRVVDVTRDASGLTDVPASAFLRPFSPRLKHLDRVRVRRVTHEMSVAARTNRCFHLWWHPHNFGTHLRENMALLDAILDHFDGLRRHDRFESVTMGDLASRDHVAQQPHDADHTQGRRT